MEYQREQGGGTARGGTKPEKGSETTQTSGASVEKRLSFVLRAIPVGRTGVGDGWSSVMEKRP